MMMVGFRLCFFYLAVTLFCCCLATPDHSWKFVPSKDIHYWFFFFSLTVHGSAASLLSGGSSLYGSAEERQANEVRRLKRELVDARDQVMSLSSQLSTNVSSRYKFDI